MYNDEFCSAEGYCRVDTSLYANYQCPADDDDDECEKVLKPDCRVRTLELRKCEDACDCFYDDEYCGANGYCRVDQTLYKNF